MQRSALSFSTWTDYLPNGGFFRLGHVRFCRPPQIGHAAEVFQSFLRLFYSQIVQQGLERLKPNCSGSAISETAGTGGGRFQMREARAAPDTSFSTPKSLLCKDNFLHIVGEYRVHACLAQAQGPYCHPQIASRIHAGSNRDLERCAAPTLRATPPQESENEIVVVLLPGCIEGQCSQEVNESKLEKNIKKYNGY